MISKIWAEHSLKTYSYRSFIHNCFENNKDMLEQYSANPRSDFEDLYNQTISNYAKLFGKDYISPPEFVYKSYEEELMLNNTIFYEVNLLRLVMYHHYEHAISVLIDEDEFELFRSLNNTPNDSVTDYLLAEHRKNPEKMLNRCFYKYRFYNDNKQFRSYSMDQGSYSKFLWRKKYPEELFEGMNYANDGPEFFIKGGPKFYNFIDSNHSVTGTRADGSRIIKFSYDSYCPKSYVLFKDTTKVSSTNNQENQNNQNKKIEHLYKLNLDDLADNSSECIQMYTVFKDEGDYLSTGNKFLLRGKDQIFEL